ncbi:hypothetical protein Y032_0250g147 [Ancylostoma ceylanicum]|uniref:Uncharacterized protein n=4 Tax=Ancylostoma ceylanicum TaxID=53326 RepID=A0A016SCZ0_9BILA|nr:hypothetical protein Y032_0250g147 [Ancylostoma ceylanicum]
MFRLILSFGYDFKMTDAKEVTNVAAADAAEKVETEVKLEDGDTNKVAENGEEAKEQVDTAENGEAEDSVEKTSEANETPSDPNAWKPHEEENSSFAKSTTETKEGEGEGETPKADKEGGEETTEKKRTYNRKVVRLPKEVFDFMARIEEDGTVRFNLTQFGVFYLNELKFMGTNVDALKWDTAEVPLLNVGIPPTAQTDRTLIVDQFSNDPEVREAQEIRLKGILENREKLKQIYASGEKILPADGVDRKAAKRQRKRERREERKKLLEAEAAGKTDGGEAKKRSAESDSSTTLEGGVAAKQPRLDASAGKTFPKKNGGPQSGQPVKQSGAKQIAAAKGAGAKKRPLIQPKRNPFNEWQTGPAYFGGGSGGRDRFRSKPLPFQDPRSREIPPLFPTRSGPAGVSPWSRPPYQEDMHKLEQVMRRAAHDNSSSFEAARQVERLGLGSAMGAMLNTVNDRDMPMSAYNDVPSRPMPPSLVDQAFSRRRDEPLGPRYGEEPYGAGRYAGGRDAPIRDISGFVEPLDEFADGSRKGGYPVERITYPTMGGGGAGGRGNTSIPPFGQSYSAFARENFGQAMEYGGGAR